FPAIYLSKSESWEFTDRNEPRRLAILWKWSSKLGSRRNVNRKRSEHCRWNINACDEQILGMNRISHLNTG
ncbi:MAG: hypothetical protein OXC62_08035, partial [Aestuariivita sp.]|nr:hypothetical protein [Aestuariivita sp.]